MVDYATYRLVQRLELSAACHQTLHATCAGSNTNGMVMYLLAVGSSMCILVHTDLRVVYLEIRDTLCQAPRIYNRLSECIR